MYHPRLKGCPYEMGQKMGKIFLQSQAQFPIQLDSFQMEFGLASAKVLEQVFPEAASEVKGITDIIGYNYKQFTAWMMCMGCCLTPIAGADVEARGCTAFSFVHQNQLVYGRNNDLPPFLRSVSKSIYYQPKNKYRFILNTSSFINGEEGINEAGLVAAMTFVKPHWEEIKPGINSVFLVRYLLENCQNVAEGIIAVNSIPIASSCNIILIDKTAKMIVAECHPDMIHLRKPEQNQKGENFIISVNHFTAEKMKQYDASDRNVYFSQERYQNAWKALKTNDFSDGIAYAKDILRGKHGFMCQYNCNLDFDTIWSSVFDITNQKVYRAEGNPLRAKFIKDIRLS